MKVSVIIPCFNVEHYIVECIESVENQSYTSLEIICVDDGSTDKTLAILHELKETSRVPFFIISQENGGAPKARNRGLQSCSGEYIQFLDADDIMRPAKIEAQVSLAAENGFPDFIVGSYERHSPDGEILKTVRYSESDELNVWLQLMTTNLGNTCANLFKAELFWMGLAWDEGLTSSQEYTLMFEILKQGGSFVFDDQINTIVRDRESGSISQQNSAKKWKRYVNLRAEILTYCRECDFPDADELDQAMFTSIRLLYPHDPESALQFYRDLIPANFVPSVSTVTTRGYIRVFKYLGFENTERFRRIVKV